MDIRLSPRRAAGSAGVTVLILLALGLCALCAYQWVRETRLRIRVDGLQAERQKLNDEKASVEAQGRRFQEEIQRVEKERGELFKSVQTNNEALVKIRSESLKAQMEADRNQRQAEAYKEVLDKANDSIRQQNEVVMKLNTDYKKLAEERNSMVAKYNDLVKEMDGTLKQYNELVEKWNAQQETLKAQAEATKK